MEGGGERGRGRGCRALKGVAGGGPPGQTSCPYTNVLRPCRRVQRVGWACSPAPGLCLIISHAPAPCCCPLPFVCPCPTTHHRHHQASYDHAFAYIGVMDGGAQCWGLADVPKYLRRGVCTTCDAGGNLCGAEGSMAVYEAVSIVPDHGGPDDDGGHADEPPSL